MDEGTQLLVNKLLTSANMKRRLNLSREGIHHVAESELSKHHVFTVIIEAYHVYIHQPLSLINMHRSGTERAERPVVRNAARVMSLEKVHRAGPPTKFTPGSQYRAKVGDRRPHFLWTRLAGGSDS